MWGLQKKKKKKGGGGGGGGTPLGRESNFQVTPFARLLQLQYVAVL